MSYGGIGGERGGGGEEGEKEAKLL